MRESKPVLAVLVKGSVIVSPCMFRRVVALWLIVVLIGSDMVGDRDVLCKKLLRKLAIWPVSGSFGWVENTI